jgi:hypothetical protein
MPFTIPERQILRRLGCVEGATAISAGEYRHLQQLINEGAALCRRNRGVFCAPLAIVSKDSASVTLEYADKSWRIESESVSRFLQNARAVWAGAITLGDDIVHAVQEAVASGDAATAAVLDAVGSECADAVMDSLQRYAAAAISPMGFILDTRRFSPGYGGWHLDAQRHFFDLLKLQEMQMSLTPSCIIVPEKSVTAIAPLY